MDGSKPSPSWICETLARHTLPRLWVKGMTFVQERHVITTPMIQAGTSALYSSAGQRTGAADIILNDLVARFKEEKRKIKLNNAFYLSQYMFISIGN